MHLTVYFDFYGLFVLLRVPFNDDWRRIVVFGHHLYRFYVIVRDIFINNLVL